MTEREQVIAELLYLKRDCLEGSATDQTLDKAIALLKAQEAVVMAGTELTEAELIEKIRKAPIVLKPNVDAVPVKHGRWIEYPLCLGYVGAYSEDHIVCSNCKSVWNIIDNEAERFEYCPNCGAKNVEE